MKRVRFVGNLECIDQQSGFFNCLIFHESNPRYKAISQLYHD